jgi:hypothetical protein
MFCTKTQEQCMRVSAWIDFMHNLACFTKNFKFCISTHVYTKSNSVHVVMFCIYTQKVEIFHITCMMTHGLWRVKNILHVNACFKKLLVNTHVSVTIAFDWVVEDSLPSTVVEFHYAASFSAPFSTNMQTEQSSNNSDRFKVKIYDRLLYTVPWLWSVLPL